METITITTENHETYSAISNFFIDYYMAAANGEFVKVYLYLVRLLNSGRAVTVAEIADYFNLTEKDICRAIRYWITEGVLRLEYTADKVLTGITMLPLSAKQSGSHKNASLLEMLGVQEESSHETKPAASHILTDTPAADRNTSRNSESDILSDTSNTETEMAAVIEKNIVPKKKSYNASFLEARQKDEDFGNLLYQTETYFGKPLTQSDVNSLLYIYEELAFAPELLEYLVEYCVSIGKKSCRYIETVARNWYENGISSVEDAKASSKNYNSAYITVLKELGIPRRVPTPAETSFIDKWYNTYAFNKDIIIEACKRAVMNNPQSANFIYVNGILENWHKQNVHKLSDIEELDRKWAAEKKKKQTAKNSSSNQFHNYKNSTSDQVMDEFESLFLKETNQ